MRGSRFTDEQNIGVLQEADAAAPTRSGWPVSLVIAAAPQRANVRWSMDSVADALANGRRIPDG